MARLLHVSVLCNHLARFGVRSHSDTLASSLPTTQAGEESERSRSDGISIASSSAEWRLPVYEWALMEVSVQLESVNSRLRTLLLHSGRSTYRG